jgi:hypothetical protein
MAGSGLGATIRVSIAVNYGLSRRFRLLTIVHLFCRSRVHLGETIALKTTDRLTGRVVGSALCLVFELHHFDIHSRPRH